MPKDLKSLEDKVRAYLQWLDDPSSLTNQNEVGRLEAKLATTRDPIRRLGIAVQLLRAKSPSPDELRQDFVESAREYAAESNIPPEAFRELGVSRSDLKEAGFVSASRPRSVGPGNGRRRVTTAQVRNEVPQHPVTLRELVELTGASPMTVRRAVSEMVEAGDLQPIGPDPDFSGRGKAPRRFARTNQGRR